jgi:hypothetical protein
LTREPTTLFLKRVAPVAGEDTFILFARPASSYVLVFRINRLQGIAERLASRSFAFLQMRQLDALNRFRFRSDAESLAAWKSARDVAWPAPPEVGEAKKPAA